MENFVRVEDEKGHIGTVNAYDFFILERSVVDVHYENGEVYPVETWRLRPLNIGGVL